jgi:hypothetical protein
VRGVSTSELGFLRKFKMEKTKQFLFMYPIDAYFEVELGKDAFFYLQAKGLSEPPQKLIERMNRAKTRDEQIELEKQAQKLEQETFKSEYSRILNSCIDLRYRKNDFGINYLVFDDTGVSDIINFRKGDRIARAGLTFVKHVAEKTYPNPDYILNQFLPSELGHLRLAGFHAWDCVEKLAKRAHKRGIDVLVDEDLTQFLISRYVQDPNFKMDFYPGFNPQVFKSLSTLNSFFEARKGKPWFVQNY